MTDGAEDDRDLEPAPPSQAPPHGVTLIDHARISAKIAEKDAPFARVLEQHRLTEPQWNEATVYWMKRMADDVAKNGIEARMPIVYSDVFGQAQDAIKPLPPMTPEEWAALTVEVQTIGNPAPALARRNLSVADYLRLGRHWARALSQDPEQNERFFAAYQSYQPKAPEA